MSVNEVSYWRLRRGRLIAAGLCIDCGKKPPTPTSKRCQRCSDRASHNQRLYQKTLKVPHGKRYVNDPGGEGATFQEIADALGISRPRAEQIYHRAIAKLWKECRRVGIDEADIVGRGFSMLATAERWAE